MPIVFTEEHWLRLIPIHTREINRLEGNVSGDIVMSLERWNGYFLFKEVAKGNHIGYFG